MPKNGCCFVSGKNQYRPGSLTRASELREFPDKEAAQSSSGGVIHLYAVTGPQSRAVQLDTVSWENTYLVTHAGKIKSACSAIVYHPTR